MVKIRLPIEDLENTVISPVIVSVLNELKKVLFIEQDTHIRILNRETEYINKNWKAGNTKSNDKNGQKSSEVELEYDIYYDEQHSIVTSLRKNQTKPVIYDKVTRFSVKPLYVESVIKLKFKIKDKSKIDLVNTLNSLKLRYIGNRDAFYHKSLYLYYPPKFVSLIIANFVKNKNYAMDLEETFEEYLNEIVDERFTLISNLSGTVGAVDLAFKEMQTGIIGYFKSDILNPEKVFNKDTNFWETELEYEIRLDQPMFYDITYPTIAYQFQLDPKLLELYTTTNTALPTGYMDMSSYYMDKFSINGLQAKIISNLRYKGTYIRIPDSDQHRDVPPRELHTRVFSVQTTIEKNDKRSLFNLKEIGDLSLREEVITALEEGEYEHITETLSSFVNLEIYEDDKKMPDTVLTVNKFLDVSTVEDLKMDKTYRVFFNVVEDLNALTPGGRRRLKNNKDVVMTMNNILDLKKNVINTGSNMVRNTDVEFKLLENKDTRMLFYSYIVACLLEDKGNDDDRI